jgi:hypothetical protein
MHRLRPLFLAFTASMMVAAADATTVRTGKPAATPAPAPARAWATRDQLRECMTVEDGLKTRFRAIEASSAAHEKMFDQVEAENTKLRDLQGQLDHDSDVSVAAFNALVKEHNQHVKLLNQDAAESRPVNDAYNNDMMAFNHKCSALVYRVDDMEAVLKERKKAAAAAASGLSPP